MGIITRLVHWPSVILYILYMTLILSFECNIINIKDLLASYAETKEITGISN